VKRLLVIASALVLVVAAAGVAGAQSTTTPTTATKQTVPPAGAARGVTATSIKVAGVGYSSLYGGADVGARARFQRANDSGGVNGRTIDDAGLTDDGGDPNAGTAAVTNAVEQGGVFAVVPAVTPQFAASAYLVKNKVPYFGWALSSDFCGNPYGFGFTGCPVPANATSNAWPNLVAKALPSGAKGRPVAIVGENTPSGKYEVGTLSAAAKSVGFRVTYADTPLAVPTGGDYAALATAALTSNGATPPDAVFLLGGPSNVVGMEQAIFGSGYQGVVTNQIQYAPNLVAPAVNALLYTQTAPTESAATDPAMQQLVTDVQKIAPDQPIDQGVIAGYWSADLFLAAVNKAGKKLTTASLLKAANAKFTYEVANTVGPTTFPSAHSLPTPCGALVASNGTAYAVKVPYSCGRVVPVK
jgi:hypothetical protein